MKLKFKKQEYQTRAVEAVVDCFKGQPYIKNVSYRIDPGVERKIEAKTDGQETQPRLFAAQKEEHGFKNGEIVLLEEDILENIQSVQKRQNLSISTDLVKTKSALLNLDVEMETGTGKTYCYIKTIFEMNKHFGWSKFIIVVPSIAIREGVKKSFEITKSHFQETYGKKPRCFIYDSKKLDGLERFSSDTGINVMIINIQAFNSTKEEQRRIYEELEEFQSRRPIDVIKANRPILILDEPQKMEGTKTQDALKGFNPLFILRYSATHKTQHNKIHRLDALDAYNQKLVKKISVCGISPRALPGTNAYLYFEQILISKQDPVAQIELEVKQKNGIKRIVRKLKKGDNLYDLSGQLNQYQGFIVSNISAITDTVEFLNGHILKIGEATGDLRESVLRRIQIREAIKAHFEKEQRLFHKGIKVLTLFFIDEVEKYRFYGDSGAERGEYAKIFEEEYNNFLETCQPEIFGHTEYWKYLKNIKTEDTHNGYFSIDTKGKMVDAISKAKKERVESTDQSAYDLILRNKERLLSFAEPTRFIFSHSALREGWDNPNVFVICILKHSRNIISRRQEVGRGLRIAVNQFGERQDDPASVHQINVLTVVASESYKDFVTALQKDISASLSERPRSADQEYFTGKILRTNDGDIEMTAKMAKLLYRYLLKNDYVDDNDNISEDYHEAVKHGMLARLPEALDAYHEQIFQLVDCIYSDFALPELTNERQGKTNQLNQNFENEAFLELWDILKQKAVYSVAFDSSVLVDKCIQTLNSELQISPLRYLIQKGEQLEDISYEQMRSADGFKLEQSFSKEMKGSIHSVIRYDLIGKIVEETELTRRTVSDILSGMKYTAFVQFKSNPEHFISEVIRLIQEQKASAIIENLHYKKIDETYDLDIFTESQNKQEIWKLGSPLKRHIYDYVLTASKVEREFVKKLEVSTDVVVYAKLPKSFTIPTPVGNYNPDWAIAFQKGKRKAVYLVAETKGSMSKMALREIETIKIACAKKFFQEINREQETNQVIYGVVDDFDNLDKILGRVDN